MKFCVIGVGRFGFHVATTLADNGMDVLAVDSNEAIIASIRDRVSQAICMHVTDEAELRSIGIEDMHTVIVAMGENFAQSILVTALLKQRLHVPMVIARAISAIHKEILTLVGADQVVLPEREMGINLADTLSNPFPTVFRITPQFSIGQRTAPKKFIGKALENLRIPETYNVRCVGRKLGEEFEIIDSSYVIQDKDQLLFVGHNDDLLKVAKL